MSTAANKYKHYIVAIGASAGGLEAIHEFFDSMPETAYTSFIIIQHLSPDYKSLLVELVGRHTDMKVYEAEDLQEIERKCVYVIPNTKLITIQKNKLRLADKKTDKLPNNAIDVFLYSLAKERKDKAIAIILSGTGTDGTKGTEAIKKEGGLVIVQDPSSAKFDGMPNSVIAAGNADFVLPPNAIYGEIIHYISPPPAFLFGNDKKDDQFLKQVFDLIQHEFHLLCRQRFGRREARLEVGDDLAQRLLAKYARPGRSQGRQDTRDRAARARVRYRSRRSGWCGAGRRAPRR